MHKIFLPIDTKSLYLNIFNDNPKGHTCTVATPIKQGHSLNEELNQVFKIPQQVDYQKYPDLIDLLRKNSKSIIRINNVFVFNKIKLNGKPIKPDGSFCIFVKEEIDPSKAQYGRIKLHYPMGLKYDALGIDNKKVMQTISDKLNNYAFLVNGFEYDFEEDSLDFVVTIVGYKNIPYSKVFRNTKGTGEKYTKAFRKTEDCYDFEIVALKKRYGDEVNPENFQEFMDRARAQALAVVENKLMRDGAENIVTLCEQYPYSLFDIQYKINNEIHYAIVKATYTNAIYADLSDEESRALALFPNAHLMLITQIFGEENLHMFSQDELDSCQRIITSIRLMA